MRFDAEARKFGAMEGGGWVVADFANVASAQSPGLAGDHGGGDLPAGEDVGGAEFDLGAGGGVVVNGNEGVGSVEADTDDVDSFGWHFWLGQCKRTAARCKEKYGGLVSD